MSQHRVDGDHGPVMACLNALGVDVGLVDGIEKLRGGGSGSSIWRVRRRGGDLVVKVAAPGSLAWDPEAPGREMAFYRDLAVDISVPVPPMVASGEDPTLGTMLVLSYLTPAPMVDPLPWSPSDYVAVARVLAGLHARWWNRDDELDALPWLRREWPLVAADLRRSLELWERLASEPAFATVLTPARIATLARYLGRLASKEFDPGSFPITLCHGDFHAGNLLRDAGGEWVIADWQQVGPGHGPADLAFFVMRAMAGGSPVPRAAMYDAWHRAVESGTATTIDLEQVHRVADAVELRSRLLHWPAFLPGAPAGLVATILDRIDELVLGR